jgi:hypothetical protein
MLFEFQWRLKDYAAAARLEGRTRTALDASLDHFDGLKVQVYGRHSSSWEDFLFAGFDSDRYAKNKYSSDETSRTGTVNRELTGRKLVLDFDEDSVKVWRFEIDPNDIQSITVLNTVSTS